MKSSSYSPYIRDHGSRIWSTYGSSIDIFFTIFPMNWRTRRATLANSSASRSHPQPKYMHQNVSICQTSAAICAAIRELNRRGGARNVEKILSRTVLPELSSQVLAKPAAGDT